MKLFNFLNKFYKKEEKEIKEIKLEEIREIIEDYFKNKKRDIKIKIEKRKEKTEIKKKEARNNLKELKEVELRNKNVPERVKQIIDGNRETYIQKVNRLIDEISFPEKIEETYEFCNSFEQIINHFGKSTIKPYQILQEFFRDISSKIAGNIRDIDKQIKEIKTILKNANMKKRKKIMMEIDNLEEIRMIEKELEKEKEKIKEKEKEKEKEIKNKEKRIEILNNCEERKKFEEKKEEKEEKEKGKKRIEMGLWHSFSVIEASLKKYERITLEKEVVNEYLKDPLKKILEDAELKILEIIDKMKKEINNNQIELKDKKKEKILQELNLMDERYFKMFLQKYKEKEEEINLLDAELEKSTITKEIERIKKEKKEGEEEINLINKEKEKVKKRLGEININELKKVLEEKIVETIDKKIIIS